MCRKLCEYTCVLVSLLSVVNDIVVVDVHEDSKRLTDNDGNPNCSVAVVTTQETANEPG